MTSRLRQNAIGVTAVAAILLLILLGTILWGVRKELFYNPTPAPLGEMRLPGPVNESVVTSVKEFVRPVKISPLGLHEEDIIYGGEQGKGEVPLRHHSGHYRLRNAHVWDPHPIYEFTAFQKKFMLLLEHDSGFAPPELHVFHVWDNVSLNVGGTKRSHHGCFYKGRVDGDDNSLVSVNLCHGMTGHIRTSDGSYFIKPTEHSLNHSLPSLHVIYRESAGKAKCGLLDDIAPKRVTASKNYGENDSYDSHLHSRRKRSTANHEYFVELMITVDRTMVDYHGEHSIENYILTLMHIVAGVFKDPSIGNPITISLVKMEILYGKSFVRWRSPRNGGVSASEMLTSYCHYQASSFNSGVPSFHHDIAVLLTRENICRVVEEDQCGILGLAELGTACEPHGSCSIVQDNGLSAAFTIAHELGHVLNVPHDGESFCKKHKNTHSYTHVMSNSHSEGTNPWSWSVCSRDIITEFLESKHGECLQNRPRIDMLEKWLQDDIYPGEVIKADKQCDLLYGGGSKICPYKQACRELWCTKANGSGCLTLHMPWGDGTPCGNGSWCQKGRCVPQNRAALTKIDGQWGPWQEYGSCSRTCGGGIKKSVRSCNNPRPENGGRYCIGHRVRYKSCQTEDCGADAKDFRQVQCSRFDSNTLEIPGLPSNVRWVPKYGMHHDDRCNLYCRAYNTNSYFSLQDKVVDGTPCVPDLYDVCVNGKCMPAGCDHILNSGIQLDICGKCGGLNDTCKLVRGHFNVSARSDGYRTVVRIPAGSSNLDIRQGTGEHRDDNYLALINTVTGEGLLNQAFTLATTMKLIPYEGTILEYSGSLSRVERINASRPLKRDLLVQVLTVGLFAPPEITYQYTVPKVNEDRYVWRHVEEWTPCDMVCNGQQTRVVACYVADTSDIINESYCSYRTKPAPLVSVCNTNCDLSWRITGKSECSSHCGRGSRNLTKECVQVFHKSRRFNVHDNMYCSHLPNTPPDTEDCEGPCDSAHWKYSEWSECSTTCGSGVQHRDAACVDDLDRPKPAEKCERQEMKVERPCVLEKCPSFVYGNWSSCSVTCGTGVKRRGIWCQRNNQIVNMGLCGTPLPVEESCEMPVCTKWTTSAWGPCSASCGSGYSKRSVTCTTDLGQPTNDADCHSDARPVALKECSKMCVLASHQAPTRIEQRSHADWVTTQWSKCSAVCDGVQTREVHCSVRHGDSRRCRSPQPPTTRSCGEACPRWVTQDWSPCSVTCGEGIKERQVLCQSHDGNFLHDSQCLRLQVKPEQEASCRAPCNVRWRQGRWSACSNSCGSGMKTRTVRCVHEPSGSRIPDSHCMDIPKPKAKTKPCLRKACSFIWQEGPWTQCSASCGPGVQSRNVTCHFINKHGWMDPEPLDTTAQCDQKRQPIQQLMCKTRDCSARFYWVYDKWSQCSRSCGTEGVQRSKLGCKDSSGRTVHNSRCRGQLRLGKKRRPCNIKPCNQYLSCKELQQHTNARTDGNYTLMVGGVNTTIYCKGMNTVKPTEYLHLPTRNENYVWVSENSSSTCGDHYPVSTHQRELFTTYERVQLDVERLLIKTNDFSFTSRREGLTPFGEAGSAGPCNEPSLCMHGLFSINLRGTPFAVSDRQQWRAQEGTYFKLEKVDPQTLRGRCSGFCGYCYPSTRHTIKLHVLPP